MLISPICLLLAAFACAARGELTYLPDPINLWSVGASESQVGNTLSFTPDGSVLVGSFFDGSARFFDPLTGSEAFPPYVPPSTGFTIRGYGGMTYSDGGSNSYMVYAVSEDPFNPTNART